MITIRMKPLSMVLALYAGCVMGGSDGDDRFAQFEPQNQFPFKQACVRPGQTEQRFNDGLMMISSNEHMDHSGHAGMGHDEHAQHRAMMEDRHGYSAKREAYRLPDIQLISQNGEEMASSQVFDAETPVMVNFIFTTCTTICPVLSATFTEVQELMGEEAAKIKMVSVTIDPEYDTPAKLKGYAEKYDADEQWSFYTGEVGDIIALERAFKVYRGNKMAHEPTTLIRLNKNDTWLRLDGFASAQDVVKEYKKLAVN